MLAAVAATAAAIAFQPLTAPWWVYADGDATYAASGLELMGGDHTQYLDHPGIPVLDAMAVTSDIRYAVARLTSHPPARTAYVDARLRHLDDSRVYFRAWALVFFLLGAAIVFGGLWRIFGGPQWGLAGLLLWLAAPQLDLYSMRFLPDGLQAGLVVGVGCLLTLAAQRRDAWLFTVAAFVLGVSVTVKLQSAGLIVPFAVALAWRPPRGDWQADLRAGARGFAVRHRVALAAFALVWIAFCIVFDRSRIPTTLTHEQASTLTWVGIAILGYALAVVVLRRVRPGLLSPFGLVLVGALAAGVLLPATWFLNDLPEMLVKITSGLTGHGVNDGVQPFAVPFSVLLHGPIVYATILVAIAAVAAVVGVLRRDPLPVIWFAGAAATGAMALARLGTPHYFQPPFVLAIPAALWLVMRLPGAVRIGAAVLLVAGLAVPPLLHARGNQAYAQLQEEQGAALASLVDRFAAPGTIALSDDYAPNPDVRWNQLVGSYLARVPAYPYRVLPVTASATQLADLRVVPRYYVGLRPLAPGDQLPTSFGTYVVGGVTTGGAGIVAARLAQGPGVDRPFGHDDARYDPSTGYYKDEAGAYWDIYGASVAAPPKRRYLPAEHHWQDAAGDVWDAKGLLVRHTASR